ncbi:hypothetical protein [Aquiflexum sp.]|uniref:hypothetical protein n=1 Tax=Aquiflexum sp. TaxID=1872584 RepID=UPI00359419F2
MPRNETQMSTDELFRKRLQKLREVIDEDILNMSTAIKDNGGSPIVEKDGGISIINGNERTYDEIFSETY